MKRFNKQLSFKEAQVVVCYSNVKFPIKEILVLKEVLSSEEKARAKKFRFQCDTNRYIAKHAVLRILLSGYLKCEPKEVDIRVDRFGKPYLSCSKNDDIHFSISSSGAFAAFSFSKNGSTGIDIERVRCIPEMLEIVERNFTSREKKRYHSYLESRRSQWFFKVWARKEAVLKSQGVGLLKPLKDLDVRNKSNFKQPWSVCVLGNPIAEEFWVADIENIQGYSIAVASEKPFTEPLVMEL